MGEKVETAGGQKLDFKENYHGPEVFPQLCFTSLQRGALVASGPRQTALLNAGQSGPI